MRRDLLPLLFATLPAWSQVVDVNGDKTVGAEEALAVAEQWKGPAGAANDHNHLGQTWEGFGNPLRIEGQFSDRTIITGSSSAKGNESVRAPLMLDNTSTRGHGLVVKSEGSGAFLSGSDAVQPQHPPDLVLGGAKGILAATEEAFTDLLIKGSERVDLIFNNEGTNTNSALRVFAGSSHVATFNTLGNLTVDGQVFDSGSSSKIDHPQDPANKYLVHSNVASPDRMNVYTGNVRLGENGEATVVLPEYFESYNTDFRYQLTCIGGFAPVYVAERIENNQFKIGGGLPGQEISWQVTGVRQDAYAKAHPVKPEQKKTEKEKGKYLHPELYGESVSKSVQRVAEE